MDFQISILTVLTDTTTSLFIFTESAKYLAPTEIQPVSAYLVATIAPFIKPQDFPGTSVSQPN